MAWLLTHGNEFVEADDRVLGDAVVAGQGNTELGGARGDDDKVSLGLVEVGQCDTKGGEKRSCVKENSKTRTVRH